ncbi:MAG: ATP-binding protein [Planctomycetota bacterium]
MLDPAQKKPISDPRPPEIDVIKELAINLLRSSTLEDLLWDIADAIGRLPGFEDSVVYLREGDKLIQRAAYGLKRSGGKNVNVPISIPLGEGIVGHVAATGIAEIISDTKEDPRYIFDQFAGRSELTVPVTFEDNVIAVLDTESRRPNAYSQADLEILQTMANVSAARIGSALAELDRARISHELASLNAELEHRVAERTVELEAASENNRRERCRLESILNSIQDGLICFDHRGKIRMMSPSAALITGWKIDQAVGTAITDVFSLEPLEGDGLVGNEALLHTRESILKRKDGEERYVRWMLGETAQGVASERVLIFSDVTHHKILTKQAEQVQRMESLGILAGGIAHDFNNNLTAIQSAMDSIVANDTNTQNALDITSIACDAARTLAAQLLTFSKGGSPIRKPTKLRKILENSIAMALSSTAVLAEWNPSEFDDVTVDVDPDQMTQVFSNLMLNAVQAMQSHGSIQIRVEKSRQYSDNSVEVQIQDQGSGIPRENLDSVFDPYFSSKADGNGLGLTICYHILKRHDGRLSLENTAHGALARVTIPQSFGAVPTESPKAEYDAPVVTGILLLEDEILVRRSISMLLQTFGHHVLESADGDEAIQVLREAVGRGEQIGLMILDLQIKGGMGGADAVPNLKKIAPNVPILACSGYSQDPVMSNYEAFGFDGVLPKPFRRETLGEVLSQHLAKR